MRQTVKNAIFLFAMLSLSKMAAAEHILRELQSGQVQAQYVTESVNNRVTWWLRIKDGAVLWKQSFDPGSPIESHILKYSQLTAIHLEQDKFSSLISCETGLLWIRGQKNAEGIWVTSFEEHLYGIASHKLRTKTIELPDVNSVRVTSESGQVVSYARTALGRILRDGQPYANEHHGNRIITKP